jgi:hypothetical protein
MNTIKIKEHFLSKNSTAYSLVTALSLHEILNHFKEYKCTVCALELTNDEKGNKTYLTPELKEINDTLKVFCRKKHIQHI